VSTVVSLRGPLSGAAISEVCADVDGLIRRGEQVVVAVAECDLTVVDAVARLRVLARRHRAQLEVVGADAALFSACGLDDVL
jgi:hypothetical protein